MAIFLEPHPTARPVNPTRGHDALAPERNQSHR